MSEKMNEAVTEKTNGVTARMHFTLLGRKLKPGDKITGEEIARLPAGRLKVLVETGFVTDAEIPDTEAQIKARKAVNAAQKAFVRAQAVVPALDTRIAEVEVKAQEIADKRGKAVLRIAKAKSDKVKAGIEASLSALRDESATIDGDLEDVKRAKAAAEVEIKAAEDKLRRAEDAYRDVQLTHFRDLAIESARMADLRVGTAAAAITEMKTALRAWAAQAGVIHPSIHSPDWWISTVAKTKEGENPEYARQVGSMASFAARLMVTHKVGHERTRH